MRTSPHCFGEFSREIPATHEKPVGIGSGRSARAPHTTAGMCAQMIRGHRCQQPAAMSFWPRLALSTLRGPHACRGSWTRVDLVPEMFGALVHDGGLVWSPGVPGSLVGVFVVDR